MDTQVIYYALGGLVVLAVLMLSLWLVWSINQNRKAVIDHVWVTFFTRHKTRYSVLCKVVPKGDLEILEPPDGARYEGDYYVKEDKVTEALYPPGAPNFLKVTVRAIDFVENQAEPIDPYNGTPITQSATLLKNIRKEEFTKVAIRQQYEAERLAGAVKPLSPLLIYAGLGAILLLLVIQLVIGFQAQSGVEDIKAGLGVN